VGQINTADANARAEGATAVQLATDASGFDQADADRIRQDLVRYTNAAIAEWDQEGNRRAPTADAALAQLYATYDQVKAVTDRQNSLVASAYANLDKLGQARTVRLLTDQQDQDHPGRCGWSSS
jgi:hypothetical protein